MRRRTMFVPVVAATVVVAGVLAAGGPAGDGPKPDAVVEQNNPAFRPFQTRVFAKTGFCGEAAVPAGLRLVLEHVSAIVEDGGSFYSVETTAGGVTVRHDLPLPEGGTVVAAQTVRIYADPATPVEVCSAGLAAISLSGHLVPVS